MGKELSEHILALNPPQGDSPKFRSYPAVARYYHENGNNDRAIELVELALTSLDGTGPIPAELKEQHLRDLLQALAKYRGSKACCGALFAAVQNSFPKVPKRDRPRKKEKNGDWSKWLTGQLVHFPGVTAQGGSMKHLVDRLQQDRGRTFMASRIASEAMFDAIRVPRTCCRSAEDINCVESAAPSQALAAQVCPK
ncbi:hypothetical protein [Mesorhizobium sp. M0222]|uniref:hypothetical protein n=1 Tax=Mesorhizobium sp. M0222 TaxID=2956921 RepID=UPI003336CABF